MLKVKNIVLTGNTVISFCQPFIDFITQFENVTFLEYSVNNSTELVCLFKVNNCENKYFSFKFWAGNNDLIFGIDDDTTKTSSSKCLYGSTTFKTSKVNGVSSGNFNFITLSKNNILYGFAINNANNYILFDLDKFNNIPMMLMANGTNKNIVLSESNSALTINNISVSALNKCLTQNILFSNAENVACMSEFLHITIGGGGANGFYDCVIDGVEYERIGNFIIKK